MSQVVCFLVDVNDQHEIADDGTAKWILAGNDV